jgi:hypothetical protein
MSRFHALLLVGVIVIAGRFCPEAAAADSQVSPADISRLGEEAIQRKTELSSAGFKVFDNLGDPTQIELEVPDADGESIIILWVASTKGPLTMELLDSSRQPVLDSNRQPVQPKVWYGTQSLVRTLKPGKYTVRLQAIDGARAFAVIGIMAQGDCQQVEEHPANPPLGYSWPYLLFKPASRAAAASRRPRADTLLVVPNNSGFATVDPDVIRSIAQCALKNNEDINALALADQLGTPILVPLFPRPELREIWSNMQLQALTRASLEEIAPKSSFDRVDLQLMAMIDAARKELEKDHPVRERVLMAGLSAAGSFTSRFTMLHPERVLAAAVISPGGWPIAPVAADRGKILRYPVGIADVEYLIGLPVDLAALRRVHLLFLLGDADTNDAVGSVDSYSVRDSELISCLFGRTMLERWRSAKRLYDRAGMRHAQFKVYPGGHEVTSKMRKDILDTFREALDAR